jgi:hypothetical protein
LKNIFAITLIISIGALALVSFSSPSSARNLNCNQLPQVAWWHSTHEKVTATVDKRYKGNWDRYILRWMTYLDRMQDLYDTGSIAVVKSRGLRLKGKQLADHISDIRVRISVLNCLKKYKASEEEEFERELGNFNTASGGKPPKTFQAPEVQKVSPQTATVTGANLDVEVTATCDKSTAVFQITNLGDKWPRLGEINIFRVQGTSLLSKRRVRMANSQQATFRIRKRGGGTYGKVGLWISPSWQKRNFKYDAIISCE